MADQFDAETRSWIMRQVKSKDTAPERLVRRVAHSMGYRFRLHRRDLPGNPDIVFPSRRKVIFVNGCFWHGHSCARAKLPQSRREYWEAKILRTVARDGQHTKSLRSLGWSALVMWECQLKDTEAVRRRIVRFLERPGTISRGSSPSTKATGRKFSTAPL
jgi:DNA mismatch endonuclease (patch repair protein)